MNTRTLTLSALIAAIIFISAQISIPLPFSPVPITLHVFTVLLFPLILPMNIAVSGILVYLALGAIGLPVFAGLKGGIGVLLGPTGGYLLGFFLATVTCGLLAKVWPTPSLVRNLAIGLVGLTIIYTIGLTGLMIVAKVPLEKAMILGLWPFLPADLVKLVGASTLAISIGKRIAFKL